MSKSYPRLIWQEQELQAESIVVIDSWDRGMHVVEVQLGAVHWYGEETCPLRIGDVLALVRPGLPDISMLVRELKAFRPGVLIVTRWEEDARS